MKPASMLPLTVMSIPFIMKLHRQTPSVTEVITLIRKQGVYYLPARYYDPAIGRFISQDDHSYLDPETVNGLNLYAYCLNNPVMNVDPSGHSVFLVMLITSIVIGAAVGGTINGISAYNEGQRGWGLFGAIAGGAVMGGAMGAVLVLGGAAGLTSVGATVAGFSMTLGAALATSVAIGVGAGLASYSLENGLRTDRDWTVGGFALSGISGGFQAAATFGVAFQGGRVGAFDNLILKDALKGVYTVDAAITRDIVKAMLTQLIPASGRTAFTYITSIVMESLAKTVFVSSIASGARKAITYLIELFSGGNV